MKTIKNITSLCLLPVFLTLLSSGVARAWQFDSLPFGAQDEPKVALHTYFKVKPDSQLGKLYVKATIKSGYHLYSVNTPDHNQRTAIKLDDSMPVELIGPWESDSSPTKHGADEHHYNSVIWSAPVKFADGVEASGQELKSVFSGLVCDAVGCQPFSQNVSAVFEGVETGKIVRGDVAETETVTTRKVIPTNTPEEIAAMADLYDADTRINYVKLDGSSGQATFLTALFGAFLGGMILNLMPCVFPVLGLKVLGFVELAGNEPRKIKLHGVAFAAGLVVSMWILAGVILGIKYIGGQEVSWGEQMGNPYFVGAMVIVLFLLGLNLAGVFEMGLFMTRVGGSRQPSTGYTGSFFSGVLTTLVATPCSGPFLGAAMGYTLAQPPLLAMFLFTVFGLGIAFPYLVLSFFPALINLLPRPGAWMETFKKFMAFTLFAAAAFFIKSFGAQTGVSGLSWLLMAICVLGLAAFFYGKWSPAYVKKTTRFVWGLAAPTLIAALGVWMYIDAAQTIAPKLAGMDDGWELWVPGKIEQILGEGKPIWVDYTAEW